MKTAEERQPVAGPAAAVPPETAGVGAEGSAGVRPLRPSQCRMHLRKTVAAAYREIVAGFVKEAMSGSCQHLKMATEVVESKKRVRAPRKRAGQLMLEQLERDFPD